MLNSLKANKVKPGSIGQPGSLSTSFFLETSSDESLLIPLAGRQHVGAVVNTQDGHLLSVLKILQKLETDAAGDHVQENSQYKHYDGCTNLIQQYTVSHQDV